MQRSTTELQLLFELSQILDKSLDLREVINPVLAALAKYLDLKHATLTLHNQRTGQIMIEAAHGLSPKQTQQGQYKLGEGVTGYVVETGQSAVIPKASESKLFLNRTQRAGETEFSFICVPITLGTETIGALSGDRPYHKEHNLEDDKRLLSIISTLIARAVKLRQEAEADKARLTEENKRLRAELQDRFKPANIVGNSHEMQLVYDQIAQVCKSPATVLIQGETGTGKELIAHAIHYNSDRAEQPFVKAHCAALPENIIESELFGHVKGAFTGATQNRKGRFELANGGTLFLDEIGEISPALQIKLLRVIQEREFEPVGSTKTIKINVRVIAATNKDLQAMVQEGTFREDLFYRLNVFPIYAPSLQKRKSDILLLADYFIGNYAKQLGKDVQRLSSAAIDMLYSYHWPGNVRELENAIERAVLVAEGNAIHPHHLPPSLQTEESSGKKERGALKAMVQSYEADLIRDTLKSNRGNIAAAARQLESTPRILGYKIQQYDINPKQYAG